MLLRAITSLDATLSAAAWIGPRSMEIIGARIGGNGWRHWVVGCADPGGRGNCPDFDFPVHRLTGAKVDIARFIFEVKRKGATVSAAYGAITGSSQ